MLQDDFSYYLAASPHLEQIRQRSSVNMETAQKLQQSLLQNSGSDSIIADGEDHTVKLRGGTAAYENNLQITEYSSKLYQEILKHEQEVQIDSDRYH
jgi:hypothetical protein